MSQEIINMIASALHDAWREPRRLEDGTFEPRLKDDGHGGEVDIANTAYVDLPSKWQAENKAAAEGVYGAIMDNFFADPDTIASIVHEQWMERNGSWAPAEQMLPYDQLSQEEKDKDMAIVLIAFDIIEAIDGKGVL